MHDITKFYMIVTDVKVKGLIASFTIIETDLGEDSDLKNHDMSSNVDGLATGHSILGQQWIVLLHTYGTIVI